MTPAAATAVKLGYDMISRVVKIEDYVSPIKIEDYDSPLNQFSEAYLRKTIVLESIFSITLAALYALSYYSKNLRAGRLVSLAMSVVFLFPLFLFDYAAVIGALIEVGRLPDPAKAAAQDTQSATRRNAFEEGCLVATDQVSEDASSSIGPGLCSAGDRTLRTIESSMSYFRFFHFAFCFSPHLYAIGKFDKEIIVFPRNLPGSFGWPYESKCHPLIHSHGNQHTTDF